MPVSGLPVGLLKWCSTWLVLAFSPLAVTHAAPPKKPTPYISKACFAESGLWSNDQNQNEHILLQQTLKQISRQGAVLKIDVAKPPIQLTDHCDDRMVVRYRLLDIQHQAQTWIIEEATAKGVRYLLMSVDGTQQLVVETRPLFSEDSNLFALVKTTVLADALSTQLSIYRHHSQGWQREVEQWRIQPCPACELDPDPQPRWTGQRLDIPRPKTPRSIRWIESAQWEESSHTWRLHEF